MCRCVCVSVMQIYYFNVRIITNINICGYYTVITLPLLFRQYVVLYYVLRAEALAAMLLVNHSLKILKLFRNKISDKGASEICRALIKNTAVLTDLDLGRFYITVYFLVMSLSLFIYIYIYIYIYMCVGMCVLFACNNPVSLSIYIYMCVCVLLIHNNILHPTHTHTTTTTTPNDFIKYYLVTDSDRKLLQC